MHNFIFSLLFKNLYGVSWHESNFQLENPIWIGFIISSIEKYDVEFYCKESNLENLTWNEIATKIHWIHAKSLKAHKTLKLKLFINWDMNKIPMKKGKSEKINKINIESYIKR